MSNLHINLTFSNTGKARIEFAPAQWDHACMQENWELVRLQSNVKCACGRTDYEHQHHLARILYQFHVVGYKPPLSMRLSLWIEKRLFIIRRNWNILTYWESP